MTNSTKELLSTSLEAHMNFLEARILNDVKREAFVQSMFRFILMLDTEYKYNIEFLYQNPVFTSSIYNESYIADKQYKNGVHFAIDIFKEIYYNLYMRFEEGIHYG